MSFKLNFYNSFKRFSTTAHLNFVLTLTKALSKAKKFQFNSLTLSFQEENLDKILPYIQDLKTLAIGLRLLRHDTSSPLGQLLDLLKACQNLTCLFLFAPEILSEQCPDLMNPLASCSLKKLRVFRTINPHVLEKFLQNPSTTRLEHIEVILKDEPLEKLPLKRSSFNKTPFELLKVFLQKEFPCLTTLMWDGPFDWSECLFKNSYWKQLKNYIMRAFIMNTRCFLISFEH